MDLAALEVYHSRPIAPTRRVALGARHLPVSPAPGFGGILLGGIVALHFPDMDEDLVDDLTRLTLQLQEGMRIPQPRLRHRFQSDRVGLQRSRHRLVGVGDGVRFDLETKGSPEQQILGAVYAAGALGPGPRRTVMDAIRKGMRWIGGSEEELVGFLAGAARSRVLTGAAAADPVGWALETLGLDGTELRGVDPDGRPGNGGAEVGAARRIGPPRRVVKRRFRDLLREAHPDHGGTIGDAAQRIADLSEARRILLSE